MTEKKATTIYDLLEELDFSKSFNMATRKVEKADGKETVQFTKDCTQAKDSKGRTIFVADEGAKWYSNGSVKSLTLRAREFNQLKLGTYPVLDKDGKPTGETTGHGYSKQYRFFINCPETVKTDIKNLTLDKDELKLMKAIRGRMKAVELRMDMEDTKIKLERTTDNQDVDIPEEIRDSLLETMASVLLQGADYMRKVKKDENLNIVY